MDEVASPKRLSASQLRQLWQDEHIVARNEAAFCHLFNMVVNEALVRRGITFEM
jgi:hypothetical protein